MRLATKSSPNSKDTGRKPRARLEEQLAATAGNTLNALDNPDDKEIFETGDASDFAGEHKMERRKSKERK